MLPTVKLYVKGIVNSHRQCQQQLRYSTLYYRQGNRTRTIQQLTQPYRQTGSSTDNSNPQAALCIQPSSNLTIMLRKIKKSVYISQMFDSADWYNIASQQPDPKEIRQSQHSAWLADMLTPYHPLYNPTRTETPPTHYKLAKSTIAHTHYSLPTTPTRPPIRT